MPDSIGLGFRSPYRNFPRRRRLRPKQLSFQVGFEPPTLCAPRGVDLTYPTSRMQRFVRTTRRSSKCEAETSYYNSTCSGWLNHYQLPDIHIPTYIPHAQWPHIHASQGSRSTWALVSLVPGGVESGWQKRATQKGETPSMEISRLVVQSLSCQPPYPPYTSMGYGNLPEL